MNALYVSLDGVVHDFVGGVADARAGRVRFIGEAATRTQSAAPDKLRDFMRSADFSIAAFKGVRERILMKNIAYAGALAALIGMDTEIIAQLTKEKYAAKKALLDSNEKAIALGYDYAKANLKCPLPFSLKRLNKTADHILIDGNTAFGLGAVFAGVTVGAWYPITPSTSLMDAFTAFCKKYRTTPEGEKNFIIIQAEDELSAAGMVVGANWAGARCFTSPSGPGISLMQEFIGLAYYAEVPAVFVDVQRVAPATGKASIMRPSSIAAAASALVAPATPSAAAVQARQPAAVSVEHHSMSALSIQQVSRTFVNPRGGQTQALLPVDFDQYRHHSRLFKAAVRAIEDMWKTRNAIDFTQRGRLSVDVRIASLEQWGEIQTALAASGNVTGATVTAMTTAAMARATAANRFPKRWTTSSSPIAERGKRMEMLPSRRFPLRIGTAKPCRRVGRGGRVKA